MADYLRQIREFVDAAHLVGRYELTRYSSGNMSKRLNDGKVLLSASKSWLGLLTPEEVALCQADSGKSINAVTPTVECDLHLGILQARRDVNVVLHFQSPYATTIACTSVIDCDFDVIIEIPVYIGKPAVVGYNSPGSKELAESVMKAAGKHDLVIMQNHGVVTVGKDYRDAIQKAGFFELACRILLTNPDAQPLGREQTEQLRKLANG